MAAEDLFIEELKTQAARDLEGAKIMLENNGPIEHVAWFCEQSYEKTIKYVYAFIEIKLHHRDLSDVNKELLENPRRKAVQLITDMVTQFSRDSWQSLNSMLSPFVGSNEDHHKVVESVLHGMGVTGPEFFDKMFEGYRIILDRELAESFVPQLEAMTEERLRENLGKFEFDRSIDEVFPAEFGLLPPSLPIQQKVQIEPRYSPELYTKRLIFIFRIFAVATWLLRFAEYSRYPSEDCDFVNLRTFRKLEPQLRPFFSLLVKEINRLQNEGDDLILSIVKTTPLEPK